MNIGDKIQSLREEVGGTYTKPSPEKVVIFCSDLKVTPHAMDYLQVSRGINLETIEHFKLGYDLTKNAISIPIYKRGELINIKYRLLEDFVSEKLEKEGITIPKSKYPKYIQEKNSERWLFNEDGIGKGQEKGGILITEGEFDCMSAWQAGFKNVVSADSGKDSYGIWLELLDTIPKVYIAYDNDKAGKQASLGLAERIGTDKSFEITYPEGVKDANEYFKSHTYEEYRKLIINAIPFYKYKYQGVKEVIHELRQKVDNVLKLNCIPFVEFEDDYIAVLSGESNIGKSSVALNIANELAGKQFPCLVLPIERGTRDMVKRYLQVRYNKSRHDIRNIEDKEWDEVIIPDVMNLPLYFSMPSTEEIEETIGKAKRYFDIKMCIVDHLDLLVRNTDTKNLNQDTARTVQMFKKLAQEHKVIFILVHHIKKPENGGSISRKPKKEDLKGTATLYQDPEAVIMLSVPEKDMSKLEIDIVKNKGTMGSRIFDFNVSTGVIGADITDKSKSEALKALEEF